VRDLAYKANQAKTMQAAYSNAVRIGYIDKSDDDRWLWSLNTIQPKGGRASGIEETEASAKAALQDAWTAWVRSAGLMEKADD
jgi:hypothetical protein